MSQEKEYSSNTPKKSNNMLQGSKDPKLDIDNGSEDDEEIICCFHLEDVNKFHTGKIDHLIYPERRIIAHTHNLPMIICRIYAFTLDGKYLIQRRSLTRKVRPGYYTDSASGHIKYSQIFNYEYIETEAWRELEEEMGAEVIYGRFLDLNVEYNRPEACELAYNFIALVDSQLTLNYREVEPESGFFTQDELHQKLATNNFVPISRQYWEKILDQNLFATIKQEYLTLISSAGQTPKRDSLIGALIGRFQPLHNGHFQLILAAFNFVSFLKIGIGSSQYSHSEENPFSFEERKEMISVALSNHNIDSSRYAIYAIPDLHNFPKWAQNMFILFGDFEIFFSNSGWIRQIMFQAGKKVGPLLKFNFQEYNGSKIRKAIKQNSSIDSLIPIAVIQYLKSIDGFNRIKNL